MIRFARGMAYLRWRLTLNHLRPTGKRDRLERASRALEVVGPALLIVLFLPGLFVAGFLGLIGGWILARPGEFHRPILVILRLVMSFEILLSLLAPVLRAAQGSVPNLTRFLLLPVSRRSLYATEAASTLVDPWLALFAVGALGLPLGILASAGPVRACLALAAALAAIALVSGLSALSASTAHLLFRDRRRGEMASVVLLALLAVGAMIPAFLSSFDPARRRRPDLDKAEKTAPSAPAPARGDVPGGRAESMPAWALVYPPELYARGIALATSARPAAGILPLVPLAIFATAAQFLAMRLYLRLLETPEVQSARRSEGRSSPIWRRLPGLTPAESAVAAAQFRLVFRSVQGKVSLCMMPVIILVMGTIATRLPADHSLRDSRIPLGILLSFLGVLFSILTLESATLNQFALDRAGLTLTFLSPASDAEILRGKAAGNALLLASRAAPCLAVAALAVPGGPLCLWLSVPVAGAAAYALLAPGGAILSAMFPKAVDLGRMGQRNKPHPAASLLGMLFLAAGAAPAAGLAAAALLIFESPALALALESGWAIAAALMARPLFRVAARLLARRRENLGLVAQGR